MAAISSQPWNFFLFLHSAITILLFLSPFTPFCHSQSDHPRNIETFFPYERTPLPPIPSRPPSSPNSDKGKITRAVLITAAITSLVAVTFFFFLQRCINTRRRRDRVSNTNSFDSFSFARPAAISNAGGVSRVGAAQPVLDREEFTRFNGNVKGLIVDENGLDVLYWRKLHERNKSESFRKEIVNRAKGDYDYNQEDEKQVIIAQKKQKAQRVQEIPLLRGTSSSSSHSPTHRQISENYRNINSFNSEAKSKPSDIDIDILPLEEKEKSKSQKPPPPPPSLPKHSPSPPPPPPPKAAVDSASSSSKPPPVPKSSSVGGSSRGNGKNVQVKLKPLHWDKVNPDSDHSMVWDKIDRGSFR